VDEAGPGRENERLRAATRDFEAVFIQQMMKVMRETVPDGGLLDGGTSEDLFSSLLDEHLSGLSAGEGSGGLADALYRQFVEGAER
jgi:flagellar protein FlgJ